MIFLFLKNHLFSVLIIVVLATAISPTEGSLTAQDNSDNVVATINQDRIYEGPLLAQLKSLAGDTPSDSDAYQRLRRQVLESAIQRRLALAYLEIINQRASHDDIQLEIIRLEKRLALKNQTVADYLQQKHINRQELEHRIDWQLSWPKYSNQFLTDSNYENFFKQRRTHFDGTRLLVSQILLHIQQRPLRTETQTLALAKEILHLIHENEVTFADAAKQFSDSPTGKKGGLVGSIEYDGAMPREFNQAAFKLKPGEISAPVKTTFGYHLIQLNDITEGSITWQMARPRLRKAMIQYLLNFLTDEGRKIATVEISKDWK
ncbi:MAG: hypothetical protein CMJ76_12355 [Planctomycetaceae bacterium]|nr:hypothetical protein [Planctomycetaceae bacterium]|tara:strand:- start:1877 stop:2833 length:957 start_codon:yes stop_codon:yes gene_type:complete